MAIDCTLAPDVVALRERARLVDGADEVHLSQIAAHVVAAFREDGSTRRATGLDLL
jgi:hypothetical protein